MATRVEINSTLASLTTVPDLKEIRNEDKSQRVYVSVLSDVTSKTKESSASLTLEEKNKFGSTSRSATMPSLGSRPRLFPKPFSKDTSSDTFANVKPPVTAFRSSSLIRKPNEETTSVKVLGGNVPPLVDQKVIENESKAGGEVVTNMTFYTGPSANTVILFEAAGAEQSKVSLAQGKTAADDHGVFSTMQTKELQSNANLEKPFQSPETSRNPEGSLPRQTSVSSGIRLVSWNSLKTGEKKDAYEDHPGEKNNKVDFSTDLQQRPKHRPVSAVFLESLKDQKHRPVEAPEEKSPTEKSWVRKPRPLSMDLTAKFEFKDLSSCKKTCSSHESKENVLITSFTDEGCHDLSEMGPKPEEMEFNKGSSSKINLKCSSQDTGILNNGKYIWETKHKSKSEQIETKPGIVTNLHGSEKVFETTSESRANRDGKKFDQKETSVFLGSESPAASSEKEHSIIRGSVKKHISLFTSENPNSSIDTEPLPSAAERENRCMNIQQRIKELTTENTDAKPGSLRRSLQSRPLSADLTKMFSSPTSSSEAKTEKPADIRNGSVNETQEHQKSKEITLAHSTDFTEAHATGNPWKPRQILKITNKTDQAETKGSFLGDSQHFSQQNENSISFTSNFEKKLKPTTVMEKTYIKTVRATMFDHNVQRHNVADDRPGTGPPLKMNNELEAKHDVVWHNRRSWMGEVEETTSVKKDHYSQSDSSKHIADLEKSGKPACSSDGKKMTPGILLEKPSVEKSEKSTPKNAEESFIFQRIEPRYEVFQMCGERALSETITMAPEKKAMTLRTRKSSVKEQRNDGDVLHADQSARVNRTSDYLKEGDVISDSKDVKAFPSRSAFREHNDYFSSECTLSEQRKDSDKTETDPILIAEKIPCSINKSKCLGTNEKISKLHSEIKNEKSEVSSMDETGRSDMIKRSSEQRSFRRGGTDYEFGTSFGHEVISTNVKKYGVQSSSVLLSGQLCRSSSSHNPDVKEESRAFALRRSLDSNRKEQDFSLDITAPENREKNKVIKVVDPEEKVRRTRSSVSDLKISERWRRKTLPYDSTKAEEVGWLTPENINRLSRTDPLHLEEGSVKKKSSKEQMEGNEANQTVVGSSDEYLKKQSSSSEPKATYFAVTYQIPGIRKEKSFVGTPSASVTSKISSSSDGGAINLDPAFSGRSKPLLQQTDKNTTGTNCREESREVYVKKDWIKEEDKDDASSKNSAFGNLDVSGKDNQKYYERGLDHSKEKIIDVDALLLKRELGNTAQTDLKSSRRKVSSYHELRSPLHFAQLHKDGELDTQKSSENNYGLSGRKAEDGYRSQILDIDALMAEYKEESVSKRAGNLQDKFSEEHSSFSRNKAKNKRNVSDKTTSYHWKEWKDQYAVSNKQGDCAEEFHRPEKLIANGKNKEKLDSSGPEFDKQKSKDRKFSPPYWGNTSSVFSDKFLNSPAEFTAKKTFIIDEDQDVNLASRNQSSKFVIDKVQPVSAVVDQKLEVNFPSKLSIKADDGLLQKRLVTKEQLSEVSPEGDWSKNVARISIIKDKDDANKVMCDNDSSKVKSKTKDWKNYTSGLGSAPPDLRRSYSEKSHQGKDNLPLAQEVRGRKDQYRSRQSFPLESVDNGWKNKLSPQSESFFHEDKKASRKEWTKQSSEKADRTEVSLVSTQRRSHSFFHKDRRTENVMDQLKQCFSRQPPEAKDTDTLVQEPDSQYGTWNEQRRSGDSFVPESPSSENDVISTRKQPPNSQPSSLCSQTEPASLVDHHDFSKDQRSTSLDRSSTDMDSTDGTDLPPPGDTYPDEKTTDFSFIDQTTILDSSALKTRVQLSKKRRHRAPISHSLRRSRGLEFENRFSLTEESDSTWMFKDSTEEKKTMQQEDSDEEEKTQRTGRLSSVPAQRLPIFPGMDHSVLKAQLRKRHESESPGEIGSAQPFKSPKSQLGTPGSRILPSSVEKEDRSEEKSPQWLKELKSKKRQSHYENQV
ncbi:uncharacterized protein KIAA1671 homolog isoform X2 [Cygnus olor]|uniref:uncharacterized protein KIAA1671 homolog isoform X2 n=1 Tax=Cygnus olor TaxID=8869 RepID=UPI001ADE744C|nr:uncharacterized protein KIAA1671 homolog isoform X2 [Cygnus olor]XP_040433205.1 uncharacterized protein KIAA1671 homolog isoform X2 [Cygnus olor]XP_040433206.1 uncharacterized protein KIAA1671 homolog isoform X2 [Cygnus olor]